MSKKQTQNVILSIASLLLLGGFSFFVWLNIFRQPEVMHSQGILCVEDARLCADGSYVRRVAPDCKFSPCPEPEASSLPDRIASSLIL